MHHIYHSDVVVVTTTAVVAKGHVCSGLESGFHPLLPELKTHNCKTGSAPAVQIWDPCLDDLDVHQPVTEILSSPSASFLEADNAPLKLIGVNPCTAALPSTADTKTGYTDFIFDLFTSANKDD